MGWYHDPLWTRCFPQYDVAKREDGIRRYWDEYYGTLERLAEQHPDRVRVFDMAEALNTEAGQRAVLDFAGCAGGEQFLIIGTRAERPKPKLQRSQARATSQQPLDPGKCVVLVPFIGFIHPGCERPFRNWSGAAIQCGGWAAMQPSTRAATRWPPTP